MVYYLKKIHPFKAPFSIVKFSIDLFSFFVISLSGVRTFQKNFRQGAPHLSGYRGTVPPALISDRFPLALLHYPAGLATPDQGKCTAWPAPQFFYPVLPIPVYETPRVQRKSPEEVEHGNAPPACHGGRRSGRGRDRTLPPL